MRPLSKLLGAAAVVAALLASTAGAAVTIRHTKAGIARARSVLLHRGDLGGRWSSTAAPKKVPEPTCPGFDPALPKVVETGAASTPTFQQRASGPFVSETSYAYATPGQEATAWHKLARRRFLRCVVKSLAQGPGQAVRFTVTAKHLLNLPELAADAAGYRVSATASQTGQSVGAYLDVVLLGGGQTISEISISTIQHPMSRKFEVRLARTVAGRM
jgi:hypothetical protein